MDSFKVSNFRIFGSEGTEVSFKPVTILTGTNSSGKSSFVKALILFKEYLDKIRNDFNRDGYFNPAAYTLDFTRADLKLKGFSSVLNRNASEDARITFAFDIAINCLIRGYSVEYSFKADKSRELDVGVLDTIVVILGSQKVFEAKADHGRLEVVYLNLDSNLLRDFAVYEVFYIIPKQFLDSYNDRPEISEILEDGTRFSPAKITATERGSRLLNLQKRFFGDIDTVVFLDKLNWMPSHHEGLSALNKLDLMVPLEALEKESLLFYFPVLEKFRGADRDECIRILREDAICCRTIKEHMGNCDPIEPLLLNLQSDTVIRPNVEKIVDEFMASGENSFIDYYLKLENESLRYRKPGFQYKRVDKKYDFIDDVKYGIRRSFELSWDETTPFTRVYDVLSAWQWAEDERTNDAWQQENKNRSECSLYRVDSDYLSRTADDDEYYYHSSHKLYDALVGFVECILRWAIMPDDLSALTYFNGSFSAAQRLHSFEENSILTRSVRKYYDVKDRLYNYRQTSSSDKSKYIPGSFMNKWIGNLGIGNSIIIDVDDEGLGYKLSVEKDDGISESLADLGHGATQMVSLLILLESTIMDCIYSPDEDLDEQYRNSPAKPILIIEEPEVSMHPCMQSKLALMFEEASMYGINFIIETHSEYLVRRTQACVARMKTREEFNHNPFVVYYFNEDGTAYDLEYSESGRFVRSFGTGFFDEAGKSSIEVLRREKEARS